MSEITEKDMQQIIDKVVTKYMNGLDEETASNPFMKKFVSGVAYIVSEVLLEYNRTINEKEQ